MNIFQGLGFSVIVAALMIFSAWLFVEVMWRLEKIHEDAPLVFIFLLIASLLFAVTQIGNVLP